MGHQRISYSVHKPNSQRLFKIDWSGLLKSAWPVMVGIGGIFIVIIIIVVVGKNTERRLQPRIRLQQERMRAATAPRPNESEMRRVELIAPTNKWSREIDFKGIEGKIETDLPIWVRINDSDTSALIVSRESDSWIGKANTIRFKSGTNFPVEFTFIAKSTQQAEQLARRTAKRPRKVVEVIARKTDWSEPIKIPKGADFKILPEGPIYLRRDNINEQRLMIVNDKEDFGEFRSVAFKAVEDSEVKIRVEWE